jgi:calcineurin-like phosphoesterase family protein
MTIFVVSDTHFGHANMLKFTRTDGSPAREFKSVEEMDECMVSRWNAVVGESDTVYHLGDVFFGDGHRHLGRLKGKKRLILGNHDAGKCPHLHRHFPKIMIWRMFREYDALLTHIPVHESALYKVKWNLHGHVHWNSLEDPRYVNCSVEPMGYGPRPIEEVILEHRRRAVDAKPGK